MDEIELFQRLGVAIAIGALVGVERHWRERDEAEGQRTAGLRTFALIGMLGGAAGLIEQALKSSSYPSGIVVVGLFLGFTAAFTRFRLREAAAEHDFSATAVVAAMLTYVLGAVAMLGDMRVAAAGGVVLVCILASREALHAFMRTLTWVELRSAIMLLAMTLVILPLIPNRAIGPFGGISPAAIWTLAIMLAALSFAGYVAVKVLGGSRGEIVAGAAGGLLSSTAITVENARRARAGDPPDLLASGALVAGAVSYLRTALLMIVLAPALTLHIVPALAAGALVLLAAAFTLTHQRSGTPTPPQTRNPFELLSVIQMALLLALIGFLARAASAWFGGTGTIIVSALAGFGDVDAATITVAGMLGSGLPVDTATYAVLVAVLSNTVAKAAYGLALGSWGFGWRFAVGSAAALGAGAIGTLAVQALT